jgi:hypothetical protein
MQKNSHVMESTGELFTRMEFNVFHWNINSSPALCHIIMCKNHSFLLRFLSDYHLKWLNLVVQCFSSCDVPVLQNTQKSEYEFPCACTKSWQYCLPYTVLGPLEEAFNWMANFHTGTLAFIFSLRGDHLTSASKQYT